MKMFNPFKAMASVFRKKPEPVVQEGRVDIISISLDGLDESEVEALERLQEVIATSGCVSIDIVCAIGKAYGHLYEEDELEDEDEFEEDEEDDETLSLEDLIRPQVEREAY